MNIQNCTAKTPMPEQRDQVGHHWYHHGARPVEPGSNVWKCPNCGHQFGVTRVKTTHAEAIRKAREMRERGVTR